MSAEQVETRIHQAAHPLGPPIGERRPGPSHDSMMPDAL